MFLHNVVQYLGDVVLGGKSLSVYDSVNTLCLVLDVERTMPDHVTHSVQP